MAKNSKKRVPGMLRHSTGQARVILNGKTHYLGLFGSPEAHARYAELIKAWEANGRRPLERVPDAVEASFAVRDLFGLYRAYLTQAGRYTKAGRSTSHRGNLEKALSELEAWAGDMRVHRFGESLLLQHRDRLSDALSGGDDLLSQHQVGR